MNTRKNNKKNMVDADLTPPTFANESISRIYQAMEQKISKLTDSINKQFTQFGNILKEGEDRLSKDIIATVREAENRLICQIESSFNKMRIDLDDVVERVLKLDAAATTNSDVKDELKKLKIKSSEYLNSIVACDLRVNGIPFRPGEDLNGLFSSICNCLKISTPAVRFIRCFKNKKSEHRNHGSSNTTIVVRLMALTEKNLFLRALRVFKKEHNFFDLRYDWLQNRWQKSEQHIHK